MGGHKVKLYGTAYSPASKRVEVALKLKGIEYEYAQEDDVYNNKSEDLLKYNPVHKKIPILVHAGKPVLESLVILEYIDETWKGPGIANILPTHPYDRAQARFWAKVIDEKLAGTMRFATLGEGEVGKKATEEAHELLQLLENEISGKKFFGGNGIGLLDIAALLIAYWVPVLEEVAGKEQLITKEKYPSLCTWRDNLLACNVVKDSVPNREGLVTYVRTRLPLYRATVPNN